VHAKLFERYLLVLRVLFSAMLLASAAFYVMRSIHWEVMWDTSIMHDINFLMRQGLAPYRDIFDNNMPGAYFLEGWAMQVFGGGDLGWRLYDYTLLTVLTASLVVIAFPYDWFAGVYAGILFALIHGSEGPRNAVQREQVMTTLILAAYALLFTGLRRQRPALLLPFGFLIGLAASLKPTVAPLALVLLGMAAYGLFKRKVRTRSYVLYGLAGLALALACNVAFLLRYHDLAAFLFISKQLIPYYAKVGNQPLGTLLVGVLPNKYLRFLGFGLLLTLLLKPRLEWENWERVTLGIGIGFGLFSYLAQRKAFDHHAYALYVFILVWSAIEFSKALNRRSWLHFVGLACFAFSMFRFLPELDSMLRHVTPDNQQADAMETDLRRLGGFSLQHQVQCFDMVDGCYGTLYRLRLLPYTTFFGDYMFFQPPGNPPMTWARGIMAADLAQQPPQVIVVTNMWLSQGYSFNKLQQWPEFAAFLDRNYHLDVARQFNQHAYRVYVLNGAAIQSATAPAPRTPAN
jgi:hypothetical protein